MDNQLSEAEFEKLKKEIGTIDGASAESIGIEWLTAPFPGKRKGKIVHAAIQTTDTTSKIVLHIKRTSRKEMQNISLLLNGLVQHLDIEGSFAEGGLSPLFLHQWDFVLFDVPTFKVDLIRKYLIDEITNMLTKTHE